jgi:hypothetical protein
MIDLFSSGLIPQLQRIFKQRDAAGRGLAPLHESRRGMDRTH